MRENSMHQRFSIENMEQIAEDLCLLGLPFLLSKAADAACDYEAQGSGLSARAFVEAANAVRTLLNHPEIATHVATESAALPSNTVLSSRAGKLQTTEKLYF